MNKSLSLMSIEMFQKQCFSLFMCRESYYSIDEFMELMEHKMSIYGVRWEEAETVLSEEEMEEYRDNIKWYFIEKINRIDITLEYFHYICSRCFSYSKSHKPLIW